MRPEIIFEDELLLAVNKPAGLHSIPGRDGNEISLKQILAEKYSSIFTIHRLDRDTSGIIVFAKDEVTHKSVSQLFEHRQTEKIYHGLVAGTMENNEGHIDAAIMEHPSGNGKMMVHAKGKSSLTEYWVTENFRNCSWVKFIIHTGRTHQIRVHCMHTGHPVLCDPLYGDGKPVFISSFKKNYKLSRHEDAERPILQRLALHASSLRFTLNQKEYFFEAPLPKDIRALLQQLRKLENKI